MCVFSCVWEGNMTTSRTKNAIMLFFPAFRIADGKTKKLVPIIPICCVDAIIVIYRIWLRIWLRTWLRIALRRRVERRSGYQTIEYRERRWHLQIRAAHRGLIDAQQGRLERYEALWCAGDVIVTVCGRCSVGNGYDGLPRTLR